MVRSIARVATAFIIFFAGPFFTEKGSVASQTRQDWPRLSLSLTVEGTKKPTHINHAGDGSGRIFVTEQKGRILIVRNNTVGKIPFLDIRHRVSCCGERGLLSVAFPPGFSKKNHFYVNYTNRSGDTVIARYRLSSDPDVADATSEKVLLTIQQPYANHNGGQLSFGPDGYLYIGTGDGGSAGDPKNSGQKTNTLLGKILRIDVESDAASYAVPPSNPFVSRKGDRSEIWAYGLRNPWRFSFDRKTGDLYIADVGQNKYEEVNFQPLSSRGGENYGWNILEGGHCFRSRRCDRAGTVLPVAEYDHSEGCSITGGIVYRGRKFKGMRGIYLYGDYCSGRIWGLRRSGGSWKNALLLDTKMSISTFGEDEAGNVYVADYGEGGIYKIEATKDQLNMK